MCGLPFTQKSNPITIVYSHEKYVRLSIQQIRWILKTIGIWPKSFKSSSLIKRYAHVLMNVICFGLIIFIFIPCVFYVMFEVEDTYSMLKFTGPLIYCLMVFIKYSSLILHGRNIRVCIEHIKNDWMNTQHHGDRAIMVRNAEFGRRLIVINAFFTYCSNMFYLAMPISKGKIIERDSNLTYQPLVYPVARMIVDTRYSPINEIFFWIQCMAGFITVAIMAAACSLIAVLTIHAYGRLEVLMQWIVHLVDGREDFCNNVDERLAIIVKEHVRILRFIVLTGKILHEISLVEIIGCTLDICLLGYYVITVGIIVQNEWETGEVTSYVTYLTLFISFIFNLFIFCYMGELVAEQCKKVSEISYMIDWHRLSGKRALAVILIMSNSSIKLTAGNFVDLSINSFGNVIKTSFAYLNMLRTLTS